MRHAALFSSPRFIPTILVLISVHPKPRAVLLYQRDALEAFSRFGLDGAILATASPALFTRATKRPNRLGRDRYHRRRGAFNEPQALCQGRCGGASGSFDGTEICLRLEIFVRTQITSLRKKIAC
jgi:hypothetical protein